MVDNIIDTQKDKICPFCANTGRTKEDQFKCKHCGRTYNRSGECPQVSATRYVQNKYTVEMWDDKRFLLEGTQSGGYIKDLYNEKELESILPWREALLKIKENLSVGLADYYTLYIRIAPNSEALRWCNRVLMEQEFKLSNAVSEIKPLLELDLEDKECQKMIREVKVLIIRIDNYKLDENLPKLNYIISTRESFDLVTILLSNLPYKDTFGKLQSSLFERPQILVDPFLIIKRKYEDPIEKEKRLLREQEI